MRRALVVLLVVLAACGGDDGEEAEEVPPADWVAAVCGEVGAAVGDLEEALAVIDELPTDIPADAPLGERAAGLREAFLALPTYVERYLAVVEATGVPATADGAAFREELRAALGSAQDTFAAAAERAEALDESTTVEEFFGGAQAFAEFPQALADADLDWGPDVPPGIGEAFTADPTCRATQNRLVALVG